MPHRPELFAYLEKRVEVLLPGSRRVMGTLRGFDAFFNIVLEEAVESKPNGAEVEMGWCVVRGNAVMMMEALERVSG